MNLAQVATKLALYLANQADLPNERVDSLRFGLEIIIGTMIKGVLLFAVAWALNIVAEVAVALSAGSVFRLLAGGAHCSGYGRCLLLGIGVYLAIGKVSAIYGFSLSSCWLFYLIIICYLFCCFVAFRWAPGKVPGVELTPPKQRLFKVLSLFYLHFLLMGMFYLVVNGYKSLAFAIFLALLAQGLSLTPIGYRLIKRYDMWIIINRQGKEVYGGASEV
ncbi:MAG: accessory gene regulator B family protein [Bacillota bacterium]